MKLFYSQHLPIEICVVGSFLFAFSFCLMGKGFSLVGFVNINCCLSFVNMFIVFGKGFCLVWLDSLFKNDQRSDQYLRNCLRKRLVLFCSGAQMTSSIQRQVYLTEEMATAFDAELSSNKEYEGRVTNLFSDVRQEFQSFIETNPEWRPFAIPKNAPRHQFSLFMKDIVGFEGLADSLGYKVHAIYFNAVELFLKKKNLL